MTTLEHDPIHRIREFNRFYTNVIGALGDAHLDTPYSLTEARVLYELAQRDETEVLELRHGVDIDAGYLSRMLTRLDTAGLLTRDRSATDGRRQVIRLTEHGRNEFAMLDALAAKGIADLVEGLDTERTRRLLAAMRTIQSELGAPRRRETVIRPPSHGDLGWVIGRHAELYGLEYGWDETYEALVARIVADYAAHHDPARERGWIATVDGERVGSIFCVRADDETAKLRLLLVDPTARGLGIGSRLVDACLDFAREVGYRRITLWTNDNLTAARHIYQRAGFTLDRSEAHHSFGHDLVGQYWSRAL